MKAKSKQIFVLFLFAAGFQLIACEKTVEESTDTVSTSSETTAAVVESATTACAELDGFESVLCSDSSVRELDTDLARMYKKLIARSGHEQQADARANQAIWIRQRNACLDIAAPKRRMCIDAVYFERLEAVENQLEALDD